MDTLTSAEKAIAARRLAAARPVVAALAGIAAPEAFWERHGDLAALVAALDPDVVLRSDGGTAHPEISVILHGPEAVVEHGLKVHDSSALVRPALVNGAAGVVATVGRQPVAVIGFTVSRGKIVEIDVMADPERLRQLDLAVLD